MFKDVKHFDAQNPEIGSLVKEVDVSKKKDLSKFLDKAPDIRDLEIQSRLKKRSEKNECFNRGDSINFFLPNPPPPPLGPPPPPPIFDLFNIPINVPRIDKLLNNNDFNFDFSNDYVPPAPDLPPFMVFARNIFLNGPSIAKTSSNVGTNTTRTSSNVETNTTQTMSGDHLIGELERVTEKKKTKGRNCP